MKNFRKLISVMLAAVFTLSLFGGIVPVAAETTADDSWDTWDGTEDTSWFDPSDIKASYELDTAEKVAGLSKIVRESGKQRYPYCDTKASDPQTVTTFYITKNLDLDGKEWNPIGKDYGKEFCGSVVGKLNGVEGAAVTIRNLKLTPSGDANIGFFGNLSFRAESVEGLIQHLHFEQVDINSKYRSAAAVVGYLTGNVTLDDVVVDGKIVAEGNDTAIYATNVGGLVANANHGTLTLKNCAFLGSIDSRWQKTGGLVGLSTQSLIMESCYFGGAILTDGSRANSVGGFVGIAGESTSAGQTTVLKNCQFDGLLLSRNTGNTTTGVFVGTAYANQTASTTTLQLESCFMSGYGITGNPNAAATSAWVGRVGVVGGMKLTVKNCYSLADTLLAGSNDQSETHTILLKVNDGAEQSVTTLQPDVLTVKPTLLSSAQYGTAQPGLDDPTVWQMRDSGRYPVLCPAAGFAEPLYSNADLAWFHPDAESYDIATLSQLAGLAKLSHVYHFMDRTIQLTADIDGSGAPEGQELILGGEDGFAGLLATSFRGNFQYNGHQIKNLTFRIEGVKTYQVTWKPENGQEPVVESYLAGETPVWKGDDPVRADEGNYFFTFMGWGELKPVTEDTEYVAKWRKSRKQTQEEDTTGTTADTTGEQPGGTDTAEQPSGEPAGKGCGSAISPVWMIAVLLCSGACVLKKRRML